MFATAIGRGDKDPDLAGVPEGSGNRDRSLLGRFGGEDGKQGDGNREKTHSRILVRFKAEANDFGNPEAQAALTFDVKVGRVISRKGAKLAKILLCVPSLREKED